MQMFKKFLVTYVLIGLFSVSFAQSQANPALTSDYPERYTVVKGDTLWDIAARFLADPWRWPEVWQGNPQVDNPDLIFPGDVLVLSFIDGKPVLKALRREALPQHKYKPRARVIDPRDAIPTIDPASIQAYLDAPLVTNEDELKNAGYIVSGVDNRLLMGKHDQFYARAVANQSVPEYRLFRPGRHFVDPFTEESLGWEAEHIGDARILRKGDPARFTLLSTKKDVSVRDRLRPILEKESLPFFFPKAPDNADIRGVILDLPGRANELGPIAVVALNLGERDGVEPGTVLRILSQSVEKKDPLTKEKYTLPEEKLGLLMVFRVFEKVSYAVVTNSIRQVQTLDVVVSPDLEIK